MYIKELFIYPVKSCAGIAVQEMPLAATGPLHDRMFVIVDAAWNALTQREHPRLCLVQTLITRDRLGGHLVMRIPEAGAYATPLKREGAADRDVVIWGDKCRGMDEGDRAAAMLTGFLGKPCRLVRYLPECPRLRASSSLKRLVSVSFSDAYPFLVIFQASLDDLNRRLVEPVAMDRFRPNLVIEEAKPYAEDAWSWLTVGTIVLNAAARCARCVTTVVDQQTSMTSHEPLRTLARYRRNPVGKSRLRQELPTPDRRHTPRRRHRHRHLTKRATGKIGIALVQRDTRAGVVRLLRFFIEAMSMPGSTTLSFP